MSEDDDLARRFLVLWAEYLAGLAADPKMIEPLQRWLATAASLLHNPAPDDASAGASSGPAAGASAAAGASGERDALVGELARRVDDLARRVAALEGGRQPGGREARRPRGRP